MNENEKIFVVIIIMIINNIKTTDSIRIIKVKHCIHCDRDRHIKKQCHELYSDLKIKWIKKRINRINDDKKNNRRNNNKNKLNNKFNNKLNKKWKIINDNDEKSDYVKLIYNSFMLASSLNHYLLTINFILIKVFIVLSLFNFNFAKFWILNSKCI